MRLIDADALIETFTKWFGKEMNNDEKKARTISLAIAIINDCESVEAIPVEWLEKWNEEKCIKAINWSIEDWRKENETD